MFHTAGFFLRNRSVNTGKMLSDNPPWKYGVSIGSSCITTARLSQNVFFKIRVESTAPRKLVTAVNATMIKNMGHVNIFK